MVLNSEEDSRNSVQEVSSHNDNYKSPHKNKKKKTLANSKTYRFNLNRTDNNYHFNWLELIAQEAESKRPKVIKNIGMGLDPCNSDDEEELRALARQYEQKYGKAEDIRKKKKARKIDDCADLGYGYDSEDSFIDNSEIYDEIVPENVTTAHGGFYVNSGRLEFKPRESADEDSDVEAIINEGEKAAKKQSCKKEVQEFKPPPKKKRKVFKKVKNADGTIEIVQKFPKIGPKKPEGNANRNEVLSKSGVTHFKRNSKAGKSLNPNGKKVLAGVIKKKKMINSMKSSEIPSNASASSLCNKMGTTSTTTLGGVTISLYNSTGDKQQKLKNAKDLSSNKIVKHIKQNKEEKTDDVIVTKMTGPVHKKKPNMSSASITQKKPGSEAINVKKYVEMFKKQGPDNLKPQQKSLLQNLIAQNQKTSANSNADLKASANNPNFVPKLPASITIEQVNKPLSSSGPAKTIAEHNLEVKKRQAEILKQKKILVQKNREKDEPSSKSIAKNEKKIPAKKKVKHAEYVTIRSANPLIENAGQNSKS